MGQKPTSVSACLAVALLIALFALGPKWGAGMAGEQGTTPALTIDISSSAGSAQSILTLRSITKSEYHSFKQSIKAAKERIWSDWDVSNFPTFLTLFEIPPQSWELQKYKFIKMIMERPPNGTANAVNFIASFGGSSVTAGHDSYFREAYPQVFYDTMKAVFASLQVNLIVRNQALGNNPCYPYDACAATHLGDDVDLATWEQSMNCGRDARPVESFTRSLMNLKKKPTVIYIASGTPAWQPGDCVNITAQAGNRTISAKESDVLSKPYKDVAAAAQFMKAMTFLKATSPQSKGGVNLADVYKDAAPMAQSVLALEGYKCRGPYTPDFSVKTPGGGVAWHPGMRGHRLRADSLSFALLSILEEVASYLETVLPNNVFSVVLAKELLDTANRHVISNQATSSGSEVACSAEICGSDAFCFTDYQPRVRNALASQIVDSSPIALSLPRYAYNTSFEGRQSLTASVRALEALQRRAGAADGGVSANASWTFGISFFDKSAVEKGFTRNLGYLDRKYIYTSNGRGAHLSFAVDLSRSSAVWLCECQKGFLKYPATMGDLDAAADVFVRSDVGTEAYKFGLNSASERKLPPLQLAADQCYKTEALPRGRHVVSVVQRGEQSINIAYLLYW